MNKIIAALEILSSVFMLALFIGMHLFAKRNDKTTKAFIINVSLVIFYSLCDAASYLLEGSAENTQAIKLLCIFAYTGPHIIMFTFCYYIWTIIDRENPTSLWPVFGVGIACAAETIIITIGAFNGKMYKVVDGYIEAGPWSGSTSVLSLIFLFLFYIFVISRRKYIGNIIVISTGAYIILPVSAAIVEALNHEYAFVHVSFGVMFFAIYIVIQVGELQRRMMEELTLRETLHTDKLTKLYNRRAYEEKIKSLDKDETYCVMFCDLNGLKRENDKYGHSSGDQLLLTFAKILSFYYPKEYCFRISGDEFLVIMPEEYDIFEKKYEKFMNTVMDNSWIASIGRSKGKGADIVDIVAEAEQNMYKDKNDFYMKSNLDRRKV